MGRSYASSLLSGTIPEGRGDTLTYSHDLDGPHAMLANPEYKYIHSKGREMLWHLTGPTAENQDVSNERPEILQKMRERLLALDAGRSYRAHPHLF